jgi:hypothetical protein
MNRLKGSLVNALTPQRKTSLLLGSSLLTFLEMLFIAILKTSTVRGSPFSTFHHLSVNAL